MAMEEGATLVNVPRDLFISFIAAKPRTLQIYLHKVRIEDPSSQLPQEGGHAGIRLPAAASPKEHSMACLHTTWMEFRVDRSCA